MINNASLVCKVRANEKQGATHPWVCNATRLHQYDPLQVLDSGKLHASLRIRCPHELDDPALRAHERIPLRPFMLIRTPALK
jgi:hypothetical protein